MIKEVGIEWKTVLEVRHAIVDTGMLFNDLARELGVDVRTIRNWWNGITSPSLQRFRIMEWLGGKRDREADESASGHGENSAAPKRRLKRGGKPFLVCLLFYVRKIFSFYILKALKLAGNHVILDKPQIKNVSPEKQKQEEKRKKIRGKIFSGCSFSHLKIAILRVILIVPKNEKQLSVVKGGENEGSIVRKFISELHIQILTFRVNPRYTGCVENGKHFGKIQKGDKYGKVFERGFGSRHERPWNETDGGARWTGIVCRTGGQGVGGSVLWQASRGMRRLFAQLYRALPPFMA